MNGVWQLPSIHPYWAESKRSGSTLQHFFQHSFFAIILQQFLTNLFKIIIFKFRIEFLFKIKLKNSGSMGNRGHTYETMPVILHRHRERNFFLRKIIRKHLSVYFCKPFPYPYIRYLPAKDTFHQAKRKSKMSKRGQKQSCICFLCRLQYQADSIF